VQIESAAYLLQRLQLFTRLEPDSLPRRDSNLCARPRIAAYTSLTWPHVENPKAAKFDAFTLAEGALHTFEHRFNGHFSLRLGDSSFVHDFVDDVELDQVVLPSTACLNARPDLVGPANLMIRLGLRRCQA